MDFNKKDTFGILYKINPPSKQEHCRNFQLLKTDNSTLTGTASILEKFAEELSIPCPSNLEIPFDTARKTFNILAARTQYEFNKSVEEHKNDMSEMVMQIDSCEKGFDFGNPLFDYSGESSDNEEDNANVSPDNGVQQISLEDFFLKVLHQTSAAVYLKNDNLLDNLIDHLYKDEECSNALTDKYGRNVFHLAVERKQHALIKVLLSIGINPDCKEGCGATPMTLAVLNGDTTMCQILLGSYADYNGPLFGSFPTPLDM